MNLELWHIATVPFLLGLAVSAFTNWIGASLIASAVGWCCFALPSCIGMSSSDASQVNESANMFFLLLVLAIPFILICLAGAALGRFLRQVINEK